MGGLKGECVVLGITKYIEIWNAEAYQNYLDANEGEFLQATEGIEGLTL